MHKILQYLLLSFCTVPYRENNKKRLNLRFTMEGFEILVTRSNLIMWYELNQKLWNIFPIPFHAKRKPTWWSWVWWLAKFDWYHVTQKPLYISHKSYYLLNKSYYKGKKSFKRLLQPAGSKQLFELKANYFKHNTYTCNLAIYQ